MADSAWQEVSDQVGWVTVTASVRCQHCAATIPINGPVPRVHCSRCQRATELTRLGESLDAAIGGHLMLGNHGYTVTKEDDQGGPTCRGCGSVVSLGHYYRWVGGVGAIPCPSCGRDAPTVPAPDWLKAQLPSALQVFGVDAEIAAGSGLAIEAREEEVHPISMACPSCGGGLTFTRASERTTECSYCQTSVFIPDALWLRLHPAKTMERWTITYSFGVPRRPANDEVTPVKTVTFKVTRGSTVLDQKSLQGDGQLTIGRGAGCDLCIEDRALGRTHATVELSRGRLTITDQASSTGTMVNLQKVERAELRHGDVIHVGKATVEVVVEG